MAMQKNKMICPKCGAEMNHHADKRPRMDIMFKFKSFCLRSVATLAFLAIFDSFAQARNEINVGVAGPAINPTQTYIAQDAGLWKIWPRYQGHDV